MKRAFKYLLIILPLLLADELKAQQLPLYSQYLMNGFMNNPAMAGYDGYTSFNATYRQQWVGFRDAPKTYSASFQSRLFRKSYKIVSNPIRRGNMLIPSTKGRVGLGGYIINDLNANVARTGFAFTYAYHIILNNQQLSFGLSAKAFQYRINSDKLDFGEEGDPVLNHDFVKVAFSPDADFGVLFNGVDYFVGFSISNLLQTSVMIGSNQVPDFKTYRHYWLMGGYRFNITRDLELEPGMLLKTTENWNPQGDLSLRLYYLSDFWGGLSYRTNNSMIAMVGVRFDNIFFGYSFDWTFSDIGNYNYGSHEITISVKLGDNSRRSRSSIRY
ncbi:MAG: type IX secretion system membrane protein PorP/SprF [Bacteroidetes bacterium]|nr:type IX secretion system membrane protein PorP/SprF [Bacteroidota bacterium]